MNYVNKKIISNIVTAQPKITFQPPTNNNGSYFVNLINGNQEKEYSPKIIIRSTFIANFQVNGLTEEILDNVLFPIIVRNRRDNTTTGAYFNRHGKKVDPGWSFKEISLARNGKVSIPEIITHSDILWPLIREVSKREYNKLSCLEKVIDCLKDLYDCWCEDLSDTLEKSSTA